jgi:hypothetical protein|tara:strand:+ start:328 stop:687 length:360 start_codon:yes stop_codon:yes gene_type:complete
VGIIAKILGSGDVLAKGLELIDDAFESEEEKRESKAKAKIDLMKAYAPFKLAQRYIALLFTCTFLACFFIVLIMTLMGVGDTAEVVSIMAEFKIGWIMTTIVLFYFGGGLVESVGSIKK